MLGGEEAYWQMHTWLMENPSDISDGPLLAAARRMQLNTNALQNAMRTPEVAVAIRSDAGHGKGVGLNAIPMIHINGKHAQRWRLGDDYRLRQIIEAAAEEQQ